MRKKKKNQNRKKVLIVIFVLIGFRKIKNSKEKILIECGHSNFAFTFQYYGIAVSNNGNIYEFEYKEKEQDKIVEISNLGERSESILKHIKKRKGKISKEDLEKINELSKEIKENYTGAVTLTANQVAVASPYYNNVARNFVVGRLIRVGRVSCDGNEKLSNMKVIIGGRHELIRDSAVVSTVTKESTNQAQGYAARTSIGILNDGRLFIFTTSGVESNAMSLKEVADIMLYNGCRHAFNLDGGGSMGIYYDNGFNGSGDLIFIGGYNSRPLPNTLVVTTKPA